MRYHYVITLQAPVPHGSVTNTVFGTIDLAALPEPTRSAAYNEVVMTACGMLGGAFLGDSLVTLFFTLEPDSLSA